MRFWLILAFFLTAGPAVAQPPVLRFYAVFQDHAVLQRDQPIQVWGEAAPNAPVILSLDGASTAARADAQGHWRATLPAHAAGGPYTLSAQSGRSTQTLTDILIGDVFLCSGQSNMQMAMREIAAGAAEIAASANSNIRLLNIPRYASAARLRDFHDPIAWSVAGPGAVDGFSAACFLMGRDLQRAQQVPIGLINASWGGTIIQSWISAEGFRDFDAYAEQVAINEDYIASPAVGEARWRQSAVRWWATHEPGTIAGWQAPDFDDSAWPTIAQPGPWEMFGDPALARLDGIVWFRTTIDLSAAQAARGAKLSLGIVNDYDHAFINGVYVGGHRARGAARLHDVPAGALRAGPNVIAIGVINTGGPGGMVSPPDQRALRFDDDSHARIEGPWRYRVSGAIFDVGRGPLAPWSGGLASNFNGMIAPLTPLALKGVAWYQGESNIGAAEEYQRLLPALFADWRRAFNDALPFLVVQLPNYGAPASAPQASGIASLREAQRRAVAADPHAALVVSIDIGDRYDIHPTNKQEIGRRLALAARRAIYGEDVAASGPIPLSFRRSSGRIEIAFEHAEGGLRLNGADSAIGFQLCDATRQCRFVIGAVAGNIVRLPASNRRASAIVRYCWDDSPLCNLANTHDLPAIPFEQAVD